MLKRPCGCKERVKRLKVIKEEMESGGELLRCSQQGEKQR